MKVILNQDVQNLGEVGDVKDVKPGFARNFLFPRDIAFPYNQKTIAMFEQRKAEIAALKEEKRRTSSGLKTRIESEELSLTIPAGANGKLYGAVTNQTVADELLKKGIVVERKKIEVPGRSIKSVGTYKVLVKLYESDEASLKLIIIGQEIKTEKKAEAPKRQPRRRYEEERHEENESGAEPEPEFASDKE